MYTYIFIQYKNATYIVTKNKTYCKYKQIEKILLMIYTYFHDYLRTNKKFSFREMLSKNSSKVSVIVTFLVMLELIKTGFVEVHQESTFGDIDINVVKDPELIDEIIVEE